MSSKAAASQNRGKTATAGERKLPVGQRFKKGQSGNPGGRPSIKGLRDFLDGTMADGATRRDRQWDALFLTAIDRRHRDHMRAQELLTAYDLGKPVARVEMSGPEGGPVEMADPVSMLLRRIAEKQSKDGSDGSDGSPV